MNAYEKTFLALLILFPIVGCLLYDSNEHGKYVLFGISIGVFMALGVMWLGQSAAEANRKAGNE